MPSTLPTLSTSTAKGDFPRGGGSLTPLELRDIQAEAEQDLLMEDRANDTAPQQSLKQKKKSQAKKRVAETDEESAAKKLKGSSASSGHRVDFLTFKKLSVGMTLLGCIKEINDLDLTISLPNQLTGFVSITDITRLITEKVEAIAEAEGEEEIPDLRAMFSIGQPIICSITTLQDGKGEGAKKEDGPVSKRRIELSLRPDTINAQLSASDLVSGMMLPGMIASVMDHGYSVDFGLFDGITGFLKKSALPAGVESYSEGQWVYLPIQEFKNSSRVAKLTGKMDLKSMLIPSSHPLDMDSLRAGQLVQVTVKSIFESGLNVTFLGLFNGSIDWFNLGSVSFTDLESSFKLGQKFKARISYVDLSKKKFGLTLNEHLVQWTPAPLSNKLTTAEIGLIVEEAKVLRIDHQGLLLSLPSLGQGYVHVSHLSDSLVEKVEKKFKVGSTHRARVIGFDLVDSLFLVTLQASVLDQPIMRHADITVGSFIKGKILKVDTYGVVVGVTNTIRGLCPISHMSDAKLSSPSKMFKVGSTMKFQVVSVDVKEKKVLLTHHKSWMNSKLPNVTSYAEAQPGMITQGLVTSVRDFGCIVNFYSNVHALVPVSELAEAFVQKASDLFTVGQVVKCRILSVDAAEGKMRASFKLHGQSAEQVSPELLASILIGQLVKGKVVTLVQDGVVVDINGTGARGLITKQHLSDHLSHGEKLLSLMKEGQDIPYLVVLSKDRGQIHLTAKPSLIQYAQSPSSVVNPQEYKVGMIIPGYIKNVTETACFIAFVGGFVAMATSHNIADTFVTNAADHFEKGQSVVASVAKIDEAASKVFVSLKESVLGHSSEIKAFELARLQTFFQERSHVRASLLKPGKEAEVQEWADNFSIGCGVQGSVKAVVPYGTILDLDLGGTGLITLSDKGAHKFGQKLCGQVLDIDISKKILDLKQVETVDNARANKDKKTIKKIKEVVSAGGLVEAVVSMIKEDFIILSIPSINDAVVCASSRGLNSRSVAFQRYKVGQQVLGSLSIGSKDEPGRVSFTPKQDKDAAKKLLDTRRLIKGAIDAEIKSIEDFQLGRVVTGKIQSIKATQMNIVLGANLKGRIHISEIKDNSSESSESPFAGHKSGDMIKAKVIGFHDAKSHKFLPFSHRNPVSQTVVELTLQPSELALDPFTLSSTFQESRPTLETILVGKLYNGFVTKIEKNFVWVSIGPNLMGRVGIFNLSLDSDVLDKVEKHFPLGCPVKCYVLEKDESKHTLDLSLIPNRTDSLSWETLTACQLLIGKIIKIDNGLVLQLGPHLFARANLTDLDDEYIKNPTARFTLDQFVKCYVLEVDPHNKRIDVSLRPSRIDASPASTIVDPEISTIQDLKSDSVVRGYIRNVSDNGCFVSLNRHLVARVKIAELSDSYIKDWKAGFAPGQLVKGRIVSLDEGKSRIELSLKQSVLDPNSAKARVLLSSLKEGMKVKGYVKRIESFGVFIQVQNSDISGLCHISELSDVPVKKIEKFYTVGDSVKAVILKVNEEKRRLSFGLKASYFDQMDIEEDESDIEPGSETEADEAMMVDPDINEKEELQSESASDASDEELDVESEDGVNSDTEEQDGMIVEEDSDKSDDDFNEQDPPEHVAPLDLGAFEWTAMTQEEHLPASDILGSDNEDDAYSRKRSKRTKKREKREEEARVARKELSLLEGDSATETSDDYERLILGSPNSSYLWIKYMAFHLQMTEIEKARHVAERALKTINFREPQEKLNIWVAFLNLENSYGSRESLLEVFERAVNYNEPKKVYIQMAQIYERTNKVDLALQLHQVMIKKFKTSSKIWTGYGSFLLRNEKSDDFRQLLQKCVKCLPKRKHVKTITAFAIMEFKHADAERGRTIFEGLLSNYPKRVDIWSIYLDQEIRTGDLERTRRLFERTIHLKLSSKKMKFFFKKFLEFEAKHGTEESVNHVKEEALRYVERMTE